MFEKTVLVADDDPLILEFYRKIFLPARDDLGILEAAPVARGQDLWCETFNDPRQLLQHYEGVLEKGHHCPLCILDMRMPQMSGIDAAMRLRHLDPAIEVLICTAYSDITIEDIRQKLKDNFYFVKKPFANDEFFLLSHSLVLSWNHKRNLALSEQRYRRIVETAEEGIWLVDDQWVTQFVNARMEQMLGCPTGTMLGRKATEFMDEDGGKLFRQHMVQRRSGVRESYDFRFVRQDGTPLWAWLATNPITDDVGKPVGSLAMVTDITLRKQAEEALVKRDQFLKALTEALSILLEGKAPLQRMEAALEVLGKAAGVDRVYIFENHTDFQTEAPLVSQRFEWNSGRAIPQINNPKLQSLRYNSGFQRWHSTLKSGGAISGAVREFPAGEQDLLLGQGIVSLLVVPILKGGSFWGFAGFDDCHSERTWTKVEEEMLRMAASAMGNAYEQMRSEQALRKLSMAVQHSSAAIMITDAKGRIEYVNPKFTQVTGYESHEAVGKTPRFLKSGATSPETYRILWDAITTGREWSGQLQNRKKNGDVFWEQIAIAPIQDGQGQITHFVAIKEDITQQKLAEQRILEGLREALNLSQLKNNFVSLVSHEFRTPLGAILSATELLEDCHDKFPPEKRSLYFQMVKQEVRRLTMMMEDFMAMGKLDSGRMQCTPKEINPYQFCRKTVEEVHLFFKDRPPIKLEEHGDVTQVNVAVQVLHHILTNLLMNAHKYSSKTSEVRLVVRCAGGALVMEVHDQGIGIPAENLPFIFDAFYRGTNVSNIKGTGVGLYVLKKCVDLCGGEVSVQSTVGKGSSFCVKLPVA